MKGIVAELHNDYMIVITDKGDFIKQKKTKDCNIGDEVNILSINRNSYTRQIAALAASFIIIAMLITGAYAYYTPYSYVSIDINPSFGLSINRFERVIGVKALNEDAEKLLSVSSGINNKNINYAVVEILETAYDTGYLKSGEENSIMFVVSTDDKKEQQKIAKEINETSVEELSKLSDEYNIILEKTQVNAYKKAISENISPGKAMLISKVRDVRPEMQIQEVEKMSVQQVMNIIKETKKESKKEDKKEQSNEKENEETQTAEGNIDADKESKDKKEEKQNKKEDKKTTDTSSSDNKNKDEKTNNKDNGNNNINNNNDSNNNQENENNKSNNDSEDKDDIGIGEDKDKDTSNNNESNSKDNKKDTDKEDVKTNKENGKNQNKDESSNDKKDTKGNGKK